MSKLTDMDTISPFDHMSPKRKSHGSTIDIHVEYDRKDSATSGTTSASSPRMSPCSVESGSPYLLRKVSGDRRSVRPGAPSEPNEYNFNYHKRGLFLIINNKNFHPSTGQMTREGTNVDAERLEERFQDLGFEVRRYNDVASAKITQIMYDASEYDHSDCDCFGCAILSHGIEGRIYATDGILPLEMLIVPFKGERCPSLVGKPKLFFLQACRGITNEASLDLTDSVSDRSGYSEDFESCIHPLRKIPVEADFLFSYSTVPGCYSWRNNQDGSWFIQALCIVLENYGPKMELLHMLTQVNRIVTYEFESCTDEEFTENIKQMPCIVSMLTRYVYFRPKKPDIRD
ncbi:caspase-3-like [Ylistrum balloti]|uniref:caspase-3-like n=1 Tax=Ylistrum balloti TaxID=509963 RepID=UPI002905F2DC|nr:caspase-3-like [Ylistrum balloti]